MWRSPVRDHVLMFRCDESAYPDHMFLHDFNAMRTEFYPAMWGFKLAMVLLSSFRLPLYYLSERSSSNLSLPYPP